MRYVSVGEYCVMYFGYYYNDDNNQSVFKPYLRNIYHEHMNMKLYALSKYDKSYSDMEYLENLMYGISIRYMQ